ncbi:protein FAR1-RELATED SEQUENCE 6-like [Rosa rugosa]|uniref:protein FAR1-RELATED SEQUENCE 6-like n=1 Tax=Rosa rugosa TaxID=74645 RepID=UPI002B40F276|nr:protein FAR1-RELATED SEQUENCE 6-like [Rosa rugosa]
MPTLIDVEDDGEHSMGTALGKDSMFVNRQASNDDDLYGVIVNSEEEAYNIYCEYGARMGFSVRIMQRRKTNNVVKQVNYCCSKEGFKLDSDPSEVKKADMLDIRTSCTAKIRFGLQDNNLWKATLFVPEHNHKLAELEERQFLRSN